MSDTPYSNREIDFQLSAIREDIKSYRDEDKTAHQVMYSKLEAIEAQTTKTNGRVGKLENWRWFLGGAIALIGAIFVPVITILGEIYLRSH